MQRGRDEVAGEAFKAEGGCAIGGASKTGLLRQATGAVERQAAMRALRVLHNGKEVCVAGIGEQGVLTTDVSWVRVVRDSVAREDLCLQIGGLHTPTKESRLWNTPDLAVGDTVTIEIVETEEITPHDSAEIDPDEEEEPD
jgi:hypothetical protein